MERVRAVAKVANIEEIAGGGVQLTIDASVQVEGSGKPVLHESPATVLTARQPNP